MNSPETLPFLTLPEKPCIGCGSTQFEAVQQGPHLARVCLDCRRQQPGWLSRFDAGLGKKNIRREGLPFGARAEVLQRWKHRCAWCGISATEAGLLQVGHIIPRAKVVEVWGEELADSLVNLAPTCETCNAGAHLTDECAIDLILSAIRIYR